MANKSEKYTCLCCGYKTLDEKRGSFDICPVCFWEDDMFITPTKNVDGKIDLSYLNLENDADYENYLDIPSGANHGLTLRQGRTNYKEFGACDKECLKSVRKPKKSELNKINEVKNGKMGK